MKIEFTPIGTFYCDQKYRFETPRQGVFADNSGVLELRDDPDLIDACRDLEGVERLWIVFCFHLNESWRPFIQPPVAPDGKKVSVFATRAPYRPNPIGLSCVNLDRIEKNKLFIRNHDLLDGTPVLDIKPYIPAADSFPESSVPWLDRAESLKWQIIFTETAQIQANWLKEHSGLDLYNFADVQLSLDPLNSKRKRVEIHPDGSYEIGCRTWRLDFTVNEQSRILRIEKIRSNYAPCELEPGADDLYNDKDLHRLFHTSGEGLEADSAHSVFHQR